MNQKIVSILLLAVLAIGTIASLQSINVEAATSQKTYAISDAIPNTIGLGESTLLKCGITEALASASYGWTGIKIVVTKPDGTTETLGPFTTDSTGSTYTLYTPDQVGRYNITTYFPEQEMPVNTTAVERGTTIYAGTIMLASEASSYFIVTEEASATYPSHALPSEYWSRPIDAQLREWYSVSGNWVARPDNGLALYNSDAPDTAHVLWAQQLTTGGLTGGVTADNLVASESGDAYEGKFSNSVILNGILYYNTQGSGTYGTVGTNQIRAIDLHTGEPLDWYINNTWLTFGQALYFDGYNVDGAYTYLWSVSGTTYTAYDPFDGSWVYTMTNVPSGVRTFGPHGEILIYQYNYANGRIALWNSTECGLQNAAVGTPYRGSWASNVGLRTFNASYSSCYSWNVTIPEGTVASGSYIVAHKFYTEDRVVGIEYNQTKVRVWALDISDLDSTSTAITSYIFDKWWDAPTEWYNGTNTIHYVGATNYVEDDTYGEGVIGLWSKELTTHYGFSVKTGKYLWATDSEIYLDAYGWGNMEHTWYYAYGKLYSVGVGGILYAYDLSRGKTAWTYNMTDAYGEPITGNNWWGWIALIADGKVYVGTLEHSAENPLPRGGPYIAVNATDGSEVWRVNGMFRLTRWGGNSVIGDSIIATMDTYDQRIYAIGKGPTQTTLVSPTTSVEFGKSIIIQGRITDISPGTSTTAMQLRFPNGVAAVSDDSMSDWMLYVYKQFEMPANATGVELSIDVVDANNNYRHIGTTTSDASGAYSFAWQPDISGQYTVYVTFAGSDAYYGSYAQTAYYVEEEPAATATPTPQPQSAADLYFVPLSVGMIVAIIAIGAILVLLQLKKRP